MSIIDPILSFRFVVYFHGLAPNPIDMSFQSVSGLSANIETEALKMGGENRFEYKIPTKVKYDTLKLNRGLKSLPSTLTAWVKNAVDEFKFQPIDLIIVLVDENYLPLKSWGVNGAFPVKYSIGELKAENTEILMESIDLQYNFYKSIP